MENPIVAEAMRLASLYATARVIKHRSRLGDITTITEEQAVERAKAAEKALEDHLTSMADRQQELENALNAVQARIRGEFDNPALVQFGPLMPSAEDDCLVIADRVLRKA